MREEYLTAEGIIEQNLRGIYFTLDFMSSKHGIK